MLLDLDCNIARPKPPKTALPTKIRAQLGFEDRQTGVPFANRRNRDNQPLVKKDTITLKTKPHLKEKSRVYA